MQVTLIKHTSRGICCDKEKIQQREEDGKRVVGGENDQNIDMYKNVKELKNKLKQNTESCSAQLHKQKAKLLWCKVKSLPSTEMCRESVQVFIFKRYDYILIKLSNITV